MTHRTKSKHERASQLKEELRCFIGDIVRFRHPLNYNVIFTPGVKHLMEAADAHWLVDAIASWIGTQTFDDAIKDDPRVGYLHFWHLQVDQTDNSATLYAEADTGVEPFIVQEIPYTDFPLEEISIWAGFDGRHWVLYLRSEH